MMMVLLFRTAGGEREGRATSAGSPPVPSTARAPVRGEQGEDQPEEQFQAPLCEQRGGLPGGAVGPVRSDIIHLQLGQHLATSLPSMLCALPLKMWSTATWWTMSFCDSLNDAVTTWRA